jgi:hypothetical protein
VAQLRNYISNGRASYITAYYILQEKSKHTKINNNFMMFLECRRSFHAANDNKLSTVS